VTAPVGSTPVSSPNTVKPPASAVKPVSSVPPRVIRAADYWLNGDNKGPCIRSPIGTKIGTGCSTKSLEEQAEKYENALSKTTNDKRRAEYEFELAKIYARIQDTKFYGITRESVFSYIADLVRSRMYNSFNAGQRANFWHVMNAGLKTGSIGSRDVRILASLFKHFNPNGTLTISEAFKRDIGNLIDLNGNSGQSNNSGGGFGLLDAADLALGFTPAGDVIAVVGAITGYSPVTGKPLAGLDRWLGLLGLIALGGEAVALAKGLRAGDAAARAARIRGTVNRGANIAADCIKNSFSANTKVWVSRVANEVISKAKSTLEKTKTIVKSALTAVAISSIAVGTQVLAHNEQSKLESPQVVTATINHTDPITVKLTLETSDKKLEVIEATPEHPFYALLEPKKNASGIWVNAGELEPNNWLRRANGETGIVKKLEWLTQTKRMYNLTVARDHTFFVGDGQWLVHNTVVKCPSGGVDLVNGRKPINSANAGTSVAIPASVQSNGQTSIAVNTEGYPDFMPFATSLTPSNVVTLPSGVRNHSSDMTDADAAAGITAAWRQSNGLTWHHHEDGITMILVPTNIHTYYKHTGGVATTKP
jgi:hypothetical protein